MVDYTKLSNTANDGNNASASDICDAIVDASMMQDIAEVADATKMLMSDLGAAILRSEALWYLSSAYTKKFYINEGMATLIFDDEYYAQKFVDGHSSLQLTIHKVEQSGFKRFFSEIYNTGIWAIAYCNENKSVGLPVEPHFLPTSYNPKSCQAKEFDKYSSMLMQEIRNEEREYDRKANIVELLKKNVITQIARAKVYVPINAVQNGTSTQLVVDIQYGVNLKLVTMRTDDHKVIFPIYTSVDEYRKIPMNGVNLVLMPLSEFIRVVKSSIDRDPSVFGIVSNPGSVSFMMSKPILDLYLEQESMIKQIENANG